jgi:multiple sugar transport system permease protein
MVERSSGISLELRSSLSSQGAFRMGDNVATTGAEVTRHREKTRFFAKKQQYSFKRNNLVGYLFISPWLFGFLLFSLIPIAASLVLAFTNYDLLGGTTKYIGLDNFDRMFYHDYRYWKSVQATLRYVFFTVPMRLIFALTVAVLLNTKRRAVYFYRAAYYAPSMVGGSVAVAVMWRQIFGADGLVNTVTGVDIRWFGDPKYALGTLISLAVWQFGSPMLIFLAGLRQIPHELYEAASMDGAGPVQRFRHVTLPMLTPIIFFNLVMQTIQNFQQFTQAFIITGGNGRPLDRTLLYPLYLYRRAFVNYEMGYASAMSWVMLGAIACLTAILFISSRYWVFYQGDSK